MARKFYSSEEACALILDGTSFDDKEAIDNSSYSQNSDFEDKTGTEDELAAVAQSVPEATQSQPARSGQDKGGDAGGTGGHAGGCQSKQSQGGGGGGGGGGTVSE